MPSVRLCRSILIDDLVWASTIAVNKIARPSRPSLGFTPSPGCGLPPREKVAAIAKQDLAVAQGLLPLGTVVRTRFKNCITTAVGGVEYYKCGVNYYRAVFEGNNLVYVTAQPK